MLILSATWVAVRCTSAVGDLIVHMSLAYEHDWLYARKLETQARFLMSAASSSALWALRCSIRESMIAFVRDHHPQHLARLRASFTETGTEPPAAGPGSEQPG